MNKKTNSRVRIAPFLVAISIFLSVVLYLPSSGADTTIIIDSIDSVATDSRAIAVSSNGTIYTVYSDGSGVYIRDSTDYGQSWQNEYTVYTGSTLRQATVCIDTNDNVHVAWKGDAATYYAQHKVFYSSNSTWSPVSNIRTGVGNWVAILPGPDAKVHAFYGEGNPDSIKYRNWTVSGGWGGVTTIRSAVGGTSEQKPEATITSNGTIHVIWEGWTGSRAAIYYSWSTDDGDSWGTPSIIDGGVSEAHDPSIISDQNDTMHVAWQGKNGSHNQNQIVYINNTGSGWSTPTYLTDSTDVISRQVTLAHDDDKLYAIWSDDGNGLDDEIVMRYSNDWGTYWYGETQLKDRTNSSRMPRALYYEYPLASNIPKHGFAFVFDDDYGGSPTHAFYYTSDFELNITGGVNYTFGNIYPVNSTSGLDLQPWCHVLVNKTSGGTFDVEFYENTTGSWVLRQTNSSVTNGTYWWQYTQAVNYSTTHYWKIIADNGTSNLSKILHFTTRGETPQVNTTGNPIIACDLFIYNATTDNVTDVYGMLDDSANYTETFLPYQESAGWYGNGAASVTKIGDTWYIPHRQRTGDTDRGHYLILDSSTDLEIWSEEFNISTEEVTGISLNTFERSSLRYYSGQYYFYFCYDADGTWDIAYVNSSTILGIETDLTNSSNWTEIFSGPKDPDVFLLNGTYYMVNSDGLYFDSVQTFSSPTFIVDFTQLYNSKYGENTGNNTGTILYDDTSGYFIYWRAASATLDGDAQNNDVAWYFAVSQDMQNWEVVDRHILQKNISANVGKPRYPDYYVTNNETVVVMNFDAWQGADDRSLYVWIYPGAQSFTPPSIANENPSNQSTGVSLQPWCHVQVNDTDGDTFNVTWEENSTGPWVVRQQNLTASNGTFWWQYTQANTNSTRYYWRVSSDDGTYNTSVIYYFDTQSGSNTPPSISNPTPSNGSSGISLSPWCSIQVNDTDGDTFNVTWEENSTGSWLVRQQNLTVSNGTFWWHYTQADTNSTRYYWRISADDGSNNTSAIYYFDTQNDLNHPPSVSNPTPLNGTTGSSLYPWCSIQINDTDGDTMDLYFYENSTGPWVQRQVNSTVANGTYWWHFIQASLYSTIYYWRVDADDGNNNTSEIYHFTTRSDPQPVISSPFPSNGSTGRSLQTWCSISINDPNGDTFDVNFYENSTGSWMWRQVNGTTSNDTFWWHFTQASSYSTTYYWNVTAYDGVTNVSVTYHFTTRGNLAPVISNPLPSNESTGQVTTPECSFYVSDDETFNISILENTSGTWLEVRNLTLASSGMFYFNYTNATNNGTIYYWMINVTDGLTNSSVIYWFETQGNATPPTPSSPIVERINNITNVVGVLFAALLALVLIIKGLAIPLRRNLGRL